MEIIAVISLLETGMGTVVSKVKRRRKKAIFLGGIR